MMSASCNGFVNKLHINAILRTCLLIVTLTVVFGSIQSAQAGTIVVPAGGDLQGAINAAQCGDSIVLQAGATWDGSYTLPNKSCSSATPITIRSSGVGSLPLGRVGPTDAVNMARIRSLGGGNLGGAFQTAGNAGFWILDGLEITDNAATSATINMLLDFSISSTHDVTVQRCYIHQKETGTNYNRTAQRAIQFEGRGLVAKWNYIYIIGYYYPEIQGGNDHYQMDTTALLSVGGNNMLLEDNYISTWWNQMFLGGADTPPQNSASLTGATTSSATFSNTTGLSAGVVIRFEFTVVGTFNKTGLNDSCDGTFPSNGSAPFSAASVTRTSGATLASGDANHYGITHNASDGFDGLVGICTVSGGVYTLARTRSASSTAGTVTLTVYETAMVTSVVGSTVNYTPFGRDLLASSGATSASWNYGDQGLVSDVTVRKNTFYVAPTFAHDVYLKNGYSPKGLYELKNVNRFTFEGNRVLGYPALMSTYPSNQYGTAPWQTCRHIIIRNNWIAPDLGYPESSRMAIGIVDASNYATTTPTADVQIYNNLIKNVTSFAYAKGGDGYQIYHNTLINTAPTINGYTDLMNVFGAAPATNFVFRDNVVGYHAYGMQCFTGPHTLATCYPGGTFRNNVVVESNSVNSGTIHCGTASEWGSGAALCPVVQSFSAVGFTDPVADNYRLAAASRFKGKATDRKDPGVDIDELLAAIAVGTR